MYLAVLGRQSEISIAELDALFREVKKVTSQIAVFDADDLPDIRRLGGSLKLAEKISEPVLDFLAGLADGKITFGISDYTHGATFKTVNLEAMKLKKILTRHGRSVRIVTGKGATLSTATSLHNGLSGKNPKKVELIKLDNDWYRVIGVQDIDAYSRRDQARPSRDAKVGMLPPKLAQILINLCGPLKKGAAVLDPFCGTGVVLQEAMLMGYRAYGTDVSERMIEYSKKNLEWLSDSKSTFLLSQGDATSFQWQESIDAVACEGYLGVPMSNPPTEMKLKEQKQICTEIILGFLKNLGAQIKSGTPVVIAAPAWLQTNGKYSRLLIIDEISNMGYNVDNRSREGLLYHREGQVVARDIIILRKK
ncbi:methyltransferase domain-containing protein [Candidatus Saccharibacteria bacterium]|nr:methyltransferase domain-containing protein [Candidatus Saccharibacteria bacterium]